MSNKVFHIDWIRDNYTIEEETYYQPSGHAFIKYRITFYDDKRNAKYCGQANSLDDAELNLLVNMRLAGYKINGLDSVVHAVVEPTPAEPNKYAKGGIVKEQLWGLDKEEKELFIPLSSLPDSGSRRQFDSGAVRDMAKGKGRCDLLPLGVVADLLRPDFTKPPGPELMILFWIDRFKENGRSRELYAALTRFSAHAFSSLPDMLLETAKHFEAGALKYDDNNWQKGIPVSVYIDSAIRHYLKFLRGDTDEPHDRAVCWNLMCAIWTCDNKPELNTYRLEGNEC